MAAIRQSARKNGLRFASHRGGFGGSMGGWQVTPAFVCLPGAAVLATAAAVIFGCMLVAPPQPAQSLGPPGYPAPGAGRREGRRG